MEKQFKKVFIEFESWNKVSINRAIKKLEFLWYKRKKRNQVFNIDKIFIWDKNWYYFAVPSRREYVMNNWYKEIKLEEEEKEKAEQNLQSTQADMWRYVTQIIHFSQWNKRTIKWIDTHTIKQWQFTKFYTKTGILVSINDKNVDMIETFDEKNIWN